MCVLNRKKCSWWTYRNAIHIGRMAEKHLLRCVFSHVPQFARFIYRSSHIGLLVWRQWNRYHIAAMCIKIRCSFAHFQIPNTDFHVARTGDNVRIVQKTARAQETLVAGQFTYDFCRTSGIAIVHIVHGAHVVHTAACHKITGWRKGNGHHPRRSQWNYLSYECKSTLQIELSKWTTCGSHLNFVARPCVPNDQFTIQWASHTVPANQHNITRVSKPIFHINNLPWIIGVMHRIDFIDVPFEHSFNGQFSFDCIRELTTFLCKSAVGLFLLVLLEKQTKLQFNIPLCYIYFSDVSTHLKFGDQIVDLLLKSRHFGIVLRWHRTNNLWLFTFHAKIQRSTVLYGVRVNISPMCIENRLEHYWAQHNDVHIWWL